MARLETAAQELDWWVEIITLQPCCIYYFGPFESAAAAQLAEPDYLKDLNQEGAQGIVSQVKQCQPKCLTVVLEGELSLWPYSSAPIAEKLPEYLTLL